MNAPLRGRYCDACGMFDESIYKANWHPIYFVVFSFIHRFMSRNLQETGMDYLTNKIASEIWIYNFSHTLKAHEYADIADHLENDAGRSHILKKCNAYSIAQYLGVPHQTVRRKVQFLIDKGWVVRSSDGLLSISAACEAEFKPEFNIETVRDFIASARAVMSMLEVNK
jgi:hypothetical protein